MYKVRDRLNPPSDPVVMEYCYADGSVYYTYDSYQNYRTLGDFKDIDTVVDGKFVPGVFRVNPVTIRHGTGTCTNGKIIGRGQPTGDANIRGPFMAFRGLTPYGVWDAALEEASVSKAYAKLNEANAEVGVMLAELGETLHMLGHPFSAIQKFFKSKGRFRGFDLTSDLWLQYRYGIRPMIKDISDIIATVNRDAYVQSNALRRKKNGVKRDSVTVNKTATGFSAAGFVSLETTESKVSSHTSLYYRLAYDRDWMSRWGLSPSESLSIAWELVPYSFVVDWFFSVGNWLKGMMPLPGMTYIGGCTSQKTVIKYVAEPIDPYWGTQGTKCQEFVPSKFTWDSETLIRRVGAILPAMPAIQPRGLGFSQYLDSLGLIWNGLKIRR